MAKVSAFALLLAHLWVTSAFLALAFDPMGLVYKAAHLVQRESSTNLGGAAPAILDTGDSTRPYSVDGNTFTDYASAAQRSCSIQFDNCQRAANGDSAGIFSVQDCQTQLDACLSQPSPTEQTATSTATASKTTTTTVEETSETTDPAPAAQTTMPYDDEYDVICDL